MLNFWLLSHINLAKECFIIKIIYCVLLKIQICFSDNELKKLIYEKRHICFYYFFLFLYYRFLLEMVKISKYPLSSVLKVNAAKWNFYLVYLNYIKITKLHSFIHSLILSNKMSCLDFFLQISKHFKNKIALCSNALSF